MASDIQNQNNSGEDAERDALETRFPQINDARLRPGELPPVPQAQFSPPDTHAARGEKPKASTLRFGRAGSVESGELRSMGAGYMIGISLVTSIVVGTGLGWLLDRFLIRSATPWGLIFGFLLGTVSGFVQVIQIANRLNRDESGPTSGSK